MNVPLTALKQISDHEQSLLYAFCRTNPEMFALLRRLTRYGVQEDPPISGVDSQPTAPSSNLVARLRAARSVCDAKLAHEAADLIERLAGETKAEAWLLVHKDGYRELVGPGRVDRARMEKLGMTVTELYPR